MGRRHADQLPVMRLHKRSGQARVRLGQREYFLGRWESAEARVEYHRLVSAWLENRAKGGTSTAPAPAPEPQLTAPPPPARFEEIPDDLTVGEVALRWIEEIERTIPDYRRNSKWTAAIVAAAAVNDVSTMPAREFGPRALLHVQRRLVETPAFQHPQKRGDPPRPVKMRSRRYVNDIVARVRHMFEWAMLNELVPEDRVVALSRVPSLAYGQTAAPETEPRTAVPDEVVNATLEQLTPEVAAFIMFVRLTGCRPSEAARMRMIDIVDRELSVWRYVPTTHKTKHRGKSRHIPIGPRAQRIVLDRAASRPNGTTVFTPKRSLPQPPPADVVPLRKPRKPSPRVGDSFTKDAIRIAVARAVEKANKARKAKGLPPLPPWTPYQLRYSRLREIRRLDGRDAVQATAGHADARMSDHYAPPGWEDAAAAALRSG